MSSQIIRHKKRTVFTNEEINLLLKLWSNEKFQWKFKNSLRHNLIYEEIATILNSHGLSIYPHTACEIRHKINNLKSEYKRVKAQAGSETPSWPYYKTMHAVLQNRENGILDNANYEWGDGEESMNIEMADQEVSSPEFKWDETADAVESVELSRSPSLISCQSPTPHNSIVPEKIFKSPKIELPTPKPMITYTLSKHETASTSPTSKIITAASIPTTSSSNVRRINRRLRPLRRPLQSRLVQTLLDIERRHMERLEYLEERDRRNEERQNKVAESMCNFFDTFTQYLKQNNSLLPFPASVSKPFNPSKQPTEQIKSRVINKARQPIKLQRVTVRGVNSQQRVYKNPENGKLIQIANPQKQIKSSGSVNGVNSVKSSASITQPSSTRVKTYLPETSTSTINEKFLHQTSSSQPVWFVNGDELVPLTEENSIDFKEDPLL